MHQSVAQFFPRAKADALVSQLWAECFETPFDVPRSGDVDTIAYYLEAKYKMTAQLYCALRWNQEFFSTIVHDGKSFHWGNDTSRIDAALGYRFTSYLQAKVQYSFTSDMNSAHLFATQLTVKF